MSQTSLDQKNKIFLLALFGLVSLMLLLSFASVPLYRLFCQVTGFGGTTQRASTIPTQILDRTLKIRFNADHSRDLHWDFKPEMTEMALKLGQTGLMNYKVHNLSSKPIIGTAIYNVTPSKAGLYFVKVQCFCFEEQTLEAHQETHMPVFFYIDPALNDDPDLKDVTTITLSYSFFEASSSEYKQALDKYYKMIENIDK